jgi:hypothetical protein
LQRAHAPARGTKPLTRTVADVLEQSLPALLAVAFEGQRQARGGVCGEQARVMAKPSAGMAIEPFTNAVQGLPGHGPKPIPEASEQDIR